MKTPLLTPLVVAFGLLVFSGCASAPVSPVTFATPENASDTPPRKGNYTAAYSYAQNRMTAADYPEAALYFGRAAEWTPVPGTEDGLWEFENFVNAAWACLLAGDKPGARAWLDKADAIDVQAAPSDRARYLASILSGEKHPALSPTLKNTLP